MRWKAMVLLGKLESSSKTTYGFSSRKCPPAVEQLADFENDVMSMVKNITFRKVNEPFLHELSADVKEICSSNKVFAPADKSRNMYKMDIND